MLAAIFALTVIASTVADRGPINELAVEAPSLVYIEAVRPVR